MKFTLLLVTAALFIPCIASADDLAQVKAQAATNVACKVQAALIEAQATVERFQARRIELDADMGKLSPSTYAYIRDAAEREFTFTGQLNAEMQVERLKNRFVKDRANYTKYTGKTFYYSVCSAPTEYSL